MAKPTPHIEIALELQHAYDVFNRELFQGELPMCMLTLQREKTSVGYFSAARFGNRLGQHTDEIALNPTYFSVVTILETLQTLVHEMVHLWQHHFGEPGRGRYHNGEWAKKMEAIGLMPSDTGQPGGKRVGDQMSDYAIEGGEFLRVARMLLTEEFTLSWHDRFPPAEACRAAAQLVSTSLSSDLGLPAPAVVSTPEVAADLSDRLAAAATQAPAAASVSRPGRTKYICPCKVNLWGKLDLKIICGSCGAAFVDVRLAADAVAT